MLQSHASSEETPAFNLVIFIVFVQLGEKQGENQISEHKFRQNKNSFDSFLQSSVTEETFIRHQYIKTENILCNNENMKFLRNKTAMVDYRTVISVKILSNYSQTFQNVNEILLFLVHC